jgi:hypothetical protein
MMSCSPRFAVGAMNRYVTIVVFCSPASGKSCGALTRG